MTLADLIARYRLAAHDHETPGFCSDDELREYFNDAQAEAAIRGRMLRATVENRADLCSLGLAAGNAAAELDPTLCELSYQAWRAQGDAVRSPLKLCTREWLDRNVADWRDLPVGDPCYLVKDGTALQVVPAPSRPGEILLEGYFTPARMEADGDEPGIPKMHHIHLLQWVLYRAFSKPDAELFDSNRAAQAEAEFTRYFGARPDVDLRNDTRSDEPQHIVAWL